VVLLVLLPDQAQPLRKSIKILLSPLLSQMDGFVELKLIYKFHVDNKTHLDK